MDKKPGERPASSLFWYRRLTVKMFPACAKIPPWRFSGLVACAQCGSSYRSRIPPADEIWRRRSAEKTNPAYAETSPRQFSGFAACARRGCQFESRVPPADDIEGRKVASGEIDMEFFVANKIDVRKIIRRRERSGVRLTGRQRSAPEEASTKVPRQGRSARWLAEVIQQFGSVSEQRL